MFIEVAAGRQFMVEKYPSVWFPLVTTLQCV